MQGRWVVREGTQFWASQAFWTDLPIRTPGNPTWNPMLTLTFAAENLDGQWAPYDPATELNFDQTQTFVAKNFSNLTGVGFLFDTITPQTGYPVAAQFNSFVFYVPEPATAALLLFAGAASLRLRRRS